LLVVFIVALYGFAYYLLKKGLGFALSFLLPLPEGEAGERGDNFAIGV
jgi:hypothetical protein